MTNNINTTTVINATTNTCSGQITIGSSNITGTYHNINGTSAVGQSNIPLITIQNTNWQGQQPLYAGGATGYGSNWVAFPPSAQILKDEKSDNFVIANSEVIDPERNWRYVLKYKGQVKQIALLIIQDIIQRTKDTSYTWNNETVMPPTISWGPFTFSTDNYSTTIAKEAENDKSSQKLMIEFAKLKEMKAFW
jgi:hypothetical protein